MLPLRWFAVALLLETVGAAVQSQDACVLEDIRSEFGLPGLAGFRTRDGAMQKEVVGVRKLEDPTQILHDDQFHLGSLTKAMTATLIGQLVDQGLVSWDTTLPEALPEMAESISEGHLNTTIGMLGAHHSGLYDDFGTDVELVEKLFDPTLTPLEGRTILINRLLSKEPLGVQGEYQYDNINYIILGAILENFTDGDSTWEDIITAQLFDPLNMRCGFGTPPESSTTSVDNPWGHGVAYRNDTPMPVGGPLIRRDNPPAFNPAGRVHCDMESYAAFTQLHIDGFNGLQTPLNISPETFEKLHTPYTPSFSNPLNYTSGAWGYNDGSQTPWSNGPSLTHTGSNTLHFAVVILAPKLGEEGEALASLTNVGNSILDQGTGPAGDATNAVLVEMIDGTLFP